MDSHGIRHRRSRRHCPITFGARFSINSPLPLAFSETYRPFNERDSVSECAGTFERVRNSCRAVTPARTGLAADQCSPFSRGLPVAAAQTPPRRYPPLSVWHEGSFPWQPAGTGRRREKSKVTENSRDSSATVSPQIHYTNASVTCSRQQLVPTCRASPDHAIVKDRSLAGVFS